MNMKKSYIKMLLALLGSLVSSRSIAQRDTTLQDHIKIVKAKYHFALPTIKDDHFCEKLCAIKIPKALVFIDKSDGKAVYYYIIFNFNFNRNGKFVYKSNRDNNNEALNQVTRELISLLGRTTWHVPVGARGHILEFSCKVQKVGITDVSIDARDNDNVNEICK
jgi:hypothetical protein